MSRKEIDTEVRALITGIQPALSAMNPGIEIFQRICALAEDPQAMRLSCVREAVLNTLENAQQWMQGHYRFKTDMEKAAKTLLSRAVGADDRLRLVKRT